MAEYIEREALLSQIKTYEAFDFTITDAVLAVERTPAADVVEAKHERWEDVYGGKYRNKRYRCTVCKEKALFKFYQDDLLIWHEEQKLSNYCPNCGVIMDGDFSG